MFQDTSLPSVSQLLALCSFLGACTFLGDRSNFLSDALLSEVARFLMTLFSSVRV